jgi:hypothetical protein
MSGWGLLPGLIYPARVKIFSLKLSILVVMTGLRLGRPVKAGNKKTKEGDPLCL